MEKNSSSKNFHNKSKIKNELYKLEEQLKLNERLEQQIQKKLQNLEEIQRIKQEELRKIEKELKEIKEEMRKKQEEEQIIIEEVQKIRSECALKNEELKKMNKSDEKKNKVEHRRKLNFDNLKKEEKMIELIMALYNTKFKHPNLYRKRQKANTSTFIGKPVEKRRQNGNINHSRSQSQRKDRRERITGKDDYDTERIRQWPYCSIGILQFKDDGDDSFGTGTLIGPYEVLTAAHNVYLESKKYVTDMYFLTGYDGVKYERKVQVVEVYIPEEYKNNPIKSTEDYAVLVLKESLEDYGYFGLSCLPLTNLYEKELELYGYPIDKVLDKRGNYELWGCSGKIEKDKNEQQHEDNLLKYKEIMTADGQSGSAIFFKEREGYFICGVHFSSDAGFSYGIHITEKRLINIKLWAGILSEVTQEDLNLSVSGISSEGIKYLSQFELNKISVLELSNNYFGSEGLKQLKECNFNQLKELNLSGNGIGSEGVKQLKECAFTQLNFLDLSGNGIDSDGMKQLKECPFSQLLILNLSENGIRAEGVKHLKKCMFNQLNELNLSWNILGSEGLKQLKDCPFNQLTVLNLSLNGIGSDGIKYLKESQFHQLNKLNLSCNKIENKENARNELKLIFKNMTQLFL